MSEVEQSGAERLASVVAEALGGVPETSQLPGRDPAGSATSASQSLAPTAPPTNPHTAPVEGTPEPNGHKGPNLGAWRPPEMTDEEMASLDTCAKYGGTNNDGTTKLHEIRRNLYFYLSR